MNIKQFIGLKLPPIVRTTSLKKLIAKLSAFCFVAGLSITTPLSFSANFADHEIKAVFLFNFANFVRWPDEAFVDESSPFVFCAGNPQSPTIDALNKVIQGENINGHQLILKAPFNPAALTDCHILFLEDADIAEYQHQLPGLSTREILTVSDTNNFVSSGGLIELIPNKSRIQPTINISQLEQSKLKVSSTLLRLAKIYRVPSLGSKP